MKKRIFSVCLVLVLLAGLLAGCGKQDDVQTPGNDGADGTGTETITLNWVSDGGWAQNEKADKILEKWYAVHPEIQINRIEVGSQVDDAYLANLDTMIGGGETVDLTYLTYDEVYKRVLAGGALPLDEYIQAAGDDYESMYGTLSTSLLQYRDEIYGVPYAGNTFKVFYNKTVTDAAGITIPESWSIEEFTEVARQLNDPENGFYGCIFPSNWDQICYVSAQLSGWCSVERLDDGTVVPNFDDETFKTCLKWVRDLAAVDKVTPDYGTIKAESINRRQALAEGKTAMIIDGPFTLVWLQNYMFNDPGAGELGFELGVTDIPYVNDAGREVSYNTVAGAFYVPKTAAHPAEAYEFAKFICNECPEEAANYMPIYSGADMAAATKSFTEYTDNNGVLHTEVYPEEVALAAVATPYEAYVARWNFDPTLSAYTSLMEKTLFTEQYGLYLNGEMELDEWVDMMQQLGQAEIANMN